MRARRRGVHEERPAEDEAPREDHLRILEAIRRIPRGQVCTYGGVAAAAGLRGRARLVGFILRKSPLADGVPWHRVVNAGGRISERPGEGASIQRRLLVREGVRFLASSRIDMANHAWTPQAGVKTRARGETR